VPDEDESSGHQMQIQHSALGRFFDAFIDGWYKRSLH